MPKKKYYAILYNEPDNSMIIPVKAPRNEYTGDEQFAGGYPAIFGGNGEDVGATIAKEVHEESRGTYAAPADGQFTEYRSSRIGGNEYHFYWTTDYHATESNWGPPNTRDEGEMMQVVTVPITGNFTDDDSQQVVLDKLIVLARAVGGTDKQEWDFFNSETAKALVDFVHAHVPR